MAPLPSAPPAAAHMHRAVDERFGLAASVFAQMLPATLVAPAVRPLFAMNHAGNESAMHAFMSVNMVGAIVAATAIALAPKLVPILARRIPWLIAIDALALALVAAHLPTTVVLALRTVEGACHVGTATLLFTHATDRARSRGDRKGVPVAGAALVMAVALGHIAGGGLVGLDARAPFLVGALLLAALVTVVKLPVAAAPAIASRPKVRDRSVAAELVLATSAAFVARFTVGCLVVTFALFAHRAHGVSDRAVGMLFGSMTLPFALAMYPAGLVVARGLRATTMLASAAAYGTVLALLGRTPTQLLGLSMIAMGVSSAFLFASVLSFATAGKTEAARSRAMACVNGAGCAGMLVGPATAGILCVVFRTAEDPLRGYRASFAAASIAAFALVVAALPALFRRARAELSPLDDPNLRDEADTMKDRFTLGKLAESLGGIPVWGCLPGSPAARAGIRFGDVILSVDGTPTPSIDEYYAARSRAEGEMVVIVFRDGVHLAISVPIDEEAEVSLERVAQQLVDERLVPTARPPKTSGDA